ncbi:hypothetical protein JA9_003846 [Meyerozyma sp. JA9]|nr:hypothetical protein JA9_003846 [Meyerozyma sp. JA9]
MKIDKKASDRLLNLLYTTTSKEVATKVPIVTKVLYQQDSEPQKSVLDSLAENEWRQKPIEQAVAELPRGPLTKNRSNILKFTCPNSFISQHDFYNLFPINRERRYNLVGDLRRNGLPFSAIKGRNPLSLLHSGSYYLLFESHKHACVYWMETRDKVVNGFDMKLEFVLPKESELKYMSSPFLDPGINSVLNNKPLVYESVPKTPVSTIFSSSKEKSKLLGEIKETSSTIDRDSEDYRLSDVDPTHKPLFRFLDPKTRHSSVLVRNLPMDLSPHALPKLLWDYDLAKSSSVNDCFTTIRLDPVNQVHLTLIRFADQHNAHRFVRNYHGKRWRSVSASSNKQFHSPILCEVLS